MKRKYFITAVLVSVSITFSSCSTSKLLNNNSSEYLVKDNSFKKPIKIAVLPFANETTDLAAGKLERLFFIIGMREKNYDVLNMTATDSILKSEGITDGGQLNSISPEKLQKKLLVEGLLYGTLIDAQYSTLAVASTKKVTVKIDLVKNGQSIWKDQETVKQSKLGNILNPLKGLEEQVVDKTFEKAFQKYHGHPLETYLEQVAYKLQDKMPGKRIEKSGWN